MKNRMLGLVTAEQGHLYLGYAVPSSFVTLTALALGVLPGGVPDRSVRESTSHLVLGRSVLALVTTTNDAAPESPSTRCPAHGTLGTNSTARKFGQTEVEDLDGAILRHHQVRGLDVAVNNASGMSLR